MRHVSAIKTATAVCAASVRELQNLAKNARTEPNCNSDLNDLVRSTLTMMDPGWHRGKLISRPSTEGMTPDAEERERSPDVGGAEIELQVTLGLAGNVSGDPSELRRAFMNIFSNAVEAVPTEGGQIKIVGYKIGRWARIKVVDNGPGFGIQDQDRIFQPYHTTKGSVHSGLGLSISREILNRHGGRVRAFSEAGMGTTFSILLPLAPRDGNRGGPELAGD